MRRSLHVLVPGILGVLTAGVVAALAATPAAAGGAYTAKAAADGIRATVSSAGFLLVEQLADVGAPSAQATVDSLGNSVAYAAEPYPGALVLSAPGTAGVSDKVQYPLIATSDFPAVPTSNVSLGPVALKATSSATSSQATANGDAVGEAEQLGVSRSTASASESAGSGVVAASADTVSEALEFGGVLRIGRVHAQASATLAPGGQPQLTSRLELAQVTVNGITVGFDSKGLLLPGSTVPLAGTPLDAALQSAGISVHYLAPTIDADKHGIVSAGVRISVTRNLTGTGDTTVSYTLGQASARTVSSVTAGNSISGPASLTNTPTSSAGGAGTGTPGGSAPSGAAFAPPSSAVGAGGSTAQPPVVAPQPQSAGAQVPVAMVRPHLGTSGLYLVLILAAVATVGGLQLVRLLGVRLTWIS